MINKLGFIGCLVSLTFAVPIHAQPMPAIDPLSKMFLWWDQAFKTPGAFTAEEFSRYFTPDATLTLEGQTVVRGVDQWVTHFRKIRASGSQVEIVVPFKQVFRQGDKIYTYHVIRSRREGQTACVLAAGHAVMRGSKIAEITLVRMPMDPAKGPLDPQCWTD